MRTRETSSEKAAGGTVQSVPVVGGEGEWKARAGSRREEERGRWTSCCYPVSGQPGLASAKRGEDPRQREDGCFFTGEAERGNAIQRPDPGYSQPLESGHEQHKGPNSINAMKVARVGSELEQEGCGPLWWP